MLPAPPVNAARPARWPFALLAILLCAALWLLDTHQPPAWPDAATPWFAQVRALSPATWALDRFNAHAALAPDVPLGSTVVLVATVMCTLATLLAIDVSPVLAIAVAVGMAGTRSLWSTASPGHDALPIATVAFAVAALVRPMGLLTLVLPAIAAVGFSPPAAWLILPASLASRTSKPWRLTLALSVVVLAFAVQVHVLHGIWTQIWCLSPALWTSAIGEVLRPGVSAEASAWIAIRQLATVLAGDVHLFGIVVAAFGVTYGSPEAPGLRVATLCAGVVAVAVVAAGLLPPAFAAALLLPWWAPWFGVGLTALVRLMGHHQPRLTLVFAIATAALLAPLRHATVVPGPWRSGMPATARAVAHAWHGGLVAADDDVLTRRLRLVGGTTVPADPRTLAACVASGRNVFAIGPMVTRVQQLGHRVVDRPLRPPLGAVIQDMRSNALIALAIAPTALSWSGPAGLAALTRLGISRDTPATAAIGVVARTDRGGDIRTGRQGIDVAWHPDDEIAGRQLLLPLSLAAHDGDTSISSPPTLLATGRQVSVAVFDRADEPVLRGVGSDAPGLPISLLNHADWRNVLVRDPPRCIDASDVWTSPPVSMARLSVPLAGATRANPAIVLLASDARPLVAVDGLPDAPWAAPRITVFDRQSPADASRLRDAQQRDAIPEARLARGRWIARIELGTASSLRASITPGVVPVAWLVRLAASAPRPASLAVCEVVSGERMLLGQSGTVDDETTRELTVTQGYGWHVPERVRGSVFQWSASPTATATFTLEQPGPVVLALDANGAATPAGRQALSVRVNDHVVSTDWPGARRATIPAEAMHTGVNTITLSVPQVVQPGRDARTLGVQVRQLRVITLEAR